MKLEREMVLKMEKTEILQYQRTYLHKGRKRMPSSLEFFTKEQFMLLILAFLFGRCSIFNTAFFSSAYVSAYKKKGYFNYLISLFSIFGIVSTFNRGLILKYVVSILIITLINHFFELNIYLRSLICSLSILLSGIISILIFDLAPGNFLFLFLEVIICCGCVIFFNRFIDIVTSECGFTTNEDMIFLTIGLSLSLLGLENNIDRFLDLKKVLFFLLIFVIATNNGPVMSTSMGFIIGFLDSIKGANLVENSCIFAFLSLMAGVMKNFGKLGTCVGAFCGYVISIFYLSSSPDIKLREILIASVLFCFLPFEKILVKKDQNSKTEEVEKMVREKIYGLATILENFQFDSDKKVVPIISKNEAKKMIEDTCQKVCDGCQNSFICWQQAFERTNYMLNEVKNAILKKGLVSNDDSKILRLNCLKSNEFVAVLNGFLDVLKYSKLLENGMVQKETGFKKHLEVLKDVVLDTMKMIESDIKQDKGIAREIELELSRYGYNIEKVEFYKFEDGFEVDIHLHDCYKTPKKKEIERIVKSIVGCEVEITSEIPKISGGYELSIIKKPNINIDYAILTKSKDNVNGDRVCFLQLKDGKFLACISDGMGTGEIASQNSFIVVDSLKKFTSLGFDKKIAIKMINSLLAIKNNEGFASVDICVIDRFGLKAELLKMGAMPTYIKRANEVIKISSSSLPAGVDANSTYEYLEYDIQKGDIIFMISDGVIELLGENGDERLRNYISEHDFISTQWANKQILNWVMSTSNTIKDDMTIISIKIGG